MMKFAFLSIFILTLCFKAISQIEYHTALHFQLTQYKEDKKTGEVEESIEVYYKVDLRNGAIYPYIKVEPDQEFYIARDPYTMKLFDRTIFGEIIDEEFDPGETKELLFTLQKGKRIKLEEPADYPIMFLGVNIETEFIEETTLEILDFETACYKFKIHNFPSKGYSYVYINKDITVPIKFETYLYKSRKSTESSIQTKFEIYKITYL